MHDINGTIIYIGKSKNIKKRLSQHFGGENRKSKRIQDEVATVTYAETGSELVALLKENEEIKRNKPKFNRALRRKRYQIQLSHFTDDDGYINLKAEKADGRKRAITTFSNMMAAKAHLDRIIDSYSLCQNKTSMKGGKGNCFHYTIKKCNGACIGQETPKAYNQRVQQFINKHSYENKSMVIVDKGRAVDERSIVLIEDGIFKGIGFYNLNFQLSKMDVLKSIITPMEDNRDAQHIIQSYARSKKRLKTIPLEELVS